MIERYRKCSVRFKEKNVPRNDRAWVKRKYRILIATNTKLRLWLMKQNNGEKIERCRCDYIGTYRGWKYGSHAEWLLLRSIEHVYPMRLVYDIVAKWHVGHGAAECVRTKHKAGQSRDGYGAALYRGPIQALWPWVTLEREIYLAVSGSSCWYCCSLYL